MSDLSTRHEYKPILVSRRPEISAWLLTICLVFLVVFSDFQGLTRVGLYLLLVFIGLSALMMSLGNWIDRHTALVIDHQGVRYSNGARGVSLTWGDISRVEVIPTRFGDRIIISSENDGFRYQSLGKITMNNKISGQVGFEEGEQILAVILEQSGLSDVPARQSGRGYYYSRD